MRKIWKKEWGYCCGMLHDLGKYSKEFQRKIQNDTGERVDHSTAGAKVCNEKGGYYSILSYCIAGHHAGLPDYGNTAISNSLCGRCKKGSVISKIIKMKYKFQCFIQIRLCLIQLKFRFCIKCFCKDVVFVFSRCGFSGYRIFYKNENTGRVSGETMQILEKN